MTPLRLLKNGFTARLFGTCCLVALSCPVFADDGAHWAFAPIRRPEIPATPDSATSSTALRHPIDAFVRTRLEREGLQPSPAADRRTLIRRLKYALCGLPPTQQEVRDFLGDTRPDAYERVVDRLLGSVQFGEHAARRWLDVARYSDTKGYVYSREERFWVHAWTYRDWVVRALNADLPYDRFLLLQLAADQVDDRAPGDSAAMGFLTIGRRFLGVRRDIIDDRIDVVSRGTMGLTVSCARCHDHKYDPIKTADYYSLYGVFDSCAEQLVRLPQTATAAEAFEKELVKRREAFENEIEKARGESSHRARERIGAYLEAQTRLGEFPSEDFSQILQPGDLLPAFVRRFERHLARAKRENDPVFVPWHAYAALPEESFQTEAVAVTRRLAGIPAERINAVIAMAFRDPPHSFTDVIARYTRVFDEINARWKKQLTDGATSLTDPDEEAVRQVLYGENAPCEVPAGPIVETEWFFPTRRTETLWRAQGEVDRWIIRSDAPPPFARVLLDRPEPSRPRIFRRGNPMNQGPEVPRQFLPFLAENPEPFRRGSGRLELAEEIIRPTNPLTARVIVNRIWAHHFGRGLVATPSDFGLRAPPPSHPELLDWLAARFVADGWSLKELHRSIVLSATFRQASTGPADAAARETVMGRDPDNALLWRMRPRRLTFEELRDAMLAVTDDLALQLGGKPFTLFGTPHARRRTLYGLVDRQFFPSLLRTFDCANPDLHIPERRETTVPQQALFFMNHPFVLHRVRALAAVGEHAQTVHDGIRALFRRAYQREPSTNELTESEEFLQATNTPGAALQERASSLTRWEQLSQLLLSTNEFLFID